MKKVEIVRYFNLLTSFINCLNTSICFVIKSKGIRIIKDQKILCIKTSKGSTLATCLKYIGAIAPQMKNANTA